MNDLSRLQADADACIRFLIEHQDEWGPEMLSVHGVGRSHCDRRPITLIAVDRSLVEEIGA